MKSIKIIFYLCIVLLFIAYKFTDNRQSGWYQQYLPANTGNLIGIDFTDSLTGYGITALKYVLKTTNGGDNWFVIRNDTADVGYKYIRFLNNDTGFVGIEKVGSDLILKTINGGNNWVNINSPLLHSAMFVINIDTIWVTWAEGLFGGLYRTTNGGQSWEKLGPTNYISRIYFYNSRIGFAFGAPPGVLYKTTNAGINWFVISGGGFSDLQFVDSLTGWLAAGHVYKTTDGGYNWVKQLGNNKFDKLNNKDFDVFIDVLKLSLINKDTIWEIGTSSVYYYRIKERGILHITTNGGMNWGFQVPDTSFGNEYYRQGEFINKFIGWTYLLHPRGIHTTTGGNDTIIFTGINTTGTEFPDKFSLEQNYPNPFNSMTNVKFKMLNSGFVELKVYDISGKMLKILTSRKYNSGEYTIKFDAGDIPSGIYFYSLIVDGKVMDTKKAILIK